MFDVLKLFYSVHYNIAAVCILILFAIIFVLTKKNYRTALILSAILIAINVFVYQKTVNRVWTLTEGDKTWRFSVHKDWTITEKVNEKDTLVHHWCWLDEWWDNIAKTDLVGKLWGTKQVDNYRKTSEERMNDSGPINDN